jgi:hypothetical protein
MRLVEDAKGATIYPEDELPRYQELRRQLHDRYKRPLESVDYNNEIQEGFRALVEPLWSKHGLEIEMSHAFRRYGDTPRPLTLLIVESPEVLVAPQLDDAWIDQIHGLGVYLNVFQVIDNTRKYASEFRGTMPTTRKEQIAFLANHFYCPAGGPNTTPEERRHSAEHDYNRGMYTFEPYPEKSMEPPKLPGLEEINAGFKPTAMLSLLPTTMRTEGIRLRAEKPSPYLNALEEFLLQEEEYGARRNEHGMYVPISKTSAALQYMTDLYQELGREGIEQALAHSRTAAAV